MSNPSVPRIRVLEPVHPPRTILHAWFRVLMTKIWLAYKAIVHFFSGRNELERICLRANGNHTPEVTIAIEKAILNSKEIANSSFSSLLLDLTTSQESINPSRLLDVLVLIKHIDVLNSEYPTKIRPHLERALKEMCQMMELAQQVEVERQPYDSRNPDHEAQLMRLWDTLRPDVRLPARIHPAWGEVGFQGHDPATDFRGMGVLGLHNLLDYASLYPTRALAVLGDCTANGLKWFSFAITGINLTADVHHLLTTRAARYWFYQYGSTLTSYTTLYCTLFQSFNTYWRDMKPVNVMEYNRVHSAWLNEIKKELAKGTLMSIQKT